MCRRLINPAGILALIISATFRLSSAHGEEPAFTYQSECFLDGRLENGDAFLRLNIKKDGQAWRSARLMIPAGSALREGFWPAPDRRRSGSLFYEMTMRSPIPARISMNVPCIPWIYLRERAILANKLYPFRDLLNPAVNLSADEIVSVREIAMGEYAGDTGGPYMYKMSIASIARGEDGLTVDVSLRKRGDVAGASRFCVRKGSRYYEQFAKEMERLEKEKVYFLMATKYRLPRGGSIVMGINLGGAVSRPIADSISEAFSEESRYDRTPPRVDILSLHPISENDYLGVNPVIIK